MPPGSFPVHALEHARRVWPLSIVPLVVTLLNVGRLRTLLRNTDRVFSVTFGVPRAVSTLWSFITATPDGVSVRPSVLGGYGPFLGALVASAVVTGLLAAGYLGSIDAALDGDYDFLTAVRQYARPLVTFSLLEATVGLALFLPALGARALLPVAAAILFVLAYLFFATPYLVVVADLPLVDALRRAAILATSDRRVPAFFIAYLLVSAGLSVPISLVAFRAPPVGLTLAICASTPVGLVLNVATLLFIRDLVDADTPTQAVRRVA